MNALEFLPFLGHSSIHLPFEEFLTQNGITERPNIKNDDYSNMIAVRGAGLSMEFDFYSSAKEDGIAIKSEGTFVFIKLEIMLFSGSKKDGNYSGILPFGLLATDTLESVTQKLGTPKFGNEEISIYYLDELVWSFSFEDKKLRRINAKLPNDTSRGHGICP